jgi:hypothetical protein
MMPIQSQSTRIVFTPASAPTAASRLFRRRNKAGALSAPALLLPILKPN